MKTALLFLLAFVLNASADSIPTNRICDWQPGVNVGVPGGIPIRTITNANLVTDYGADPTGKTSISTLFFNAVNNCGSGQVSYIPAGTYALSNLINFNIQNFKTIRGAGMGKTILKLYSVSGNNGALQIGGSQFPKPHATILVTSGAVKGSTNLVVSDTSTVVVGKMIRVEQIDPDYVFANGNNGNQETNNMGFMRMVISKDSTNIQIFPDLPCDLTNAPMIAVYGSFITQGVGFEDLTVDLTGASVVGSAIYFDTTYGCWLKNVEILHSNFKNAWFHWGLNNEVRGCYFHDVLASGPNHEGMDFYEHEDNNLVEDNVCYNGGFPQIIFGDWKGGCSCNVCAFNYVDGTDSGSGVAGGSISVNHGPHNCFNLFEGNVTQMFQSDGYYGSASDNTAFRNWFTGVYTNGIATNWPIAVNLDRWSYRFNLYGNVLGSPGYQTLLAPTNNHYTGAIKVVWRIGWPNMGNSDFTDNTTNPPSSDPIAYDRNVSDTLLATNNFDYKTGTISNAYAGTLPASLIYNSTPAWWPPGKRFPPIDTAASPMIVNIPAQDRFLGIVTTPPSYFGTMRVGNATIGP